jgi:hypothetical protein
MKSRIEIRQRIEMERTEGERLNNDVFHERKPSYRIHSSFGLSQRRSVFVLGVAANKGTYIPSSRIEEPRFTKMTSGYSTRNLRLWAQNHQAVSTVPPAALDLLRK